MKVIYKYMCKLNYNITVKFIFNLYKKKKEKNFKSLVLVCVSIVLVNGNITYHKNKN
jgi:hypothetical protein